MSIQLREFQSLGSGRVSLIIINNNLLFDWFLVSRSNNHLLQWSFSYIMEKSINQPAISQFVTKLLYKLRYGSSTVQYLRLHNYADATSSWKLFWKEQRISSIVLCTILKDKIKKTKLIKKKSESTEITRQIGLTRQINWTNLLNLEFVSWKCDN